MSRAEKKMAGDPYKVLGIERDAAQDAVAAAYRTLAKQLHPDLNPGGKHAEEKFKAVSSAYALLRDPEKRARFDRGEIDASGAERPRGPYYREFNDQDAGENGYRTDAGFADFAEIFSDFFGRQNFGSQPPMPGENISYALPVEFLEAVNGATKRITLGDGSTVEVRIPPGVRDGQVLRLRGKGEANALGRARGDALIAIHVRAHPYFTRKDDDIEVDLPISLTEAVLGGEVEVPTPAGPVRLNIPRRVNVGARLRIKGKGVLRPNGSRGDQYVSLRIMLPKESDPELEVFVRSWAGKDYNPRRHWQEAA